MEQTTHDFYVDTETDFHKRLLRRLRDLKTTVLVEDDGGYREALMFSRLRLRTTWTEAELETWGTKRSDTGFVGCIEKENLFPEYRPGG